MNPPSSLYAMLQVMAIVLIFLAAFLALFLGMIVCLVAAEFSRAGVSFIRTRIGNRTSNHPWVPSERREPHLAPRRIGVVH